MMAEEYRKRFRVKTEEEGFEWTPTIPRIIDNVVLQWHGACLDGRLEAARWINDSHNHWWQVLEWINREWPLRFDEFVDACQLIAVEEDKPPFDVADIIRRPGWDAVYVVLATTASAAAKLERWPNHDPMVKVPTALSHLDFVMVLWEVDPVSHKLKKDASPVWASDVSNYERVLDD